MYILFEQGKRAFKTQKQYLGQGAVMHMMVFTEHEWQAANAKPRLWVKACRLADGDSKPQDRLSYF